MEEDTINLALDILNEIRRDYGQYSDVYSVCCEFFAVLYYKETDDFCEVLYNPITKTHTLRIK